MMGHESRYVRLLFLEEVKRKAWAAALLSLALFFALPVAMAMVLSYQPNGYVPLEEVLQRRVKNVQMMLNFGDGTYPVVTMILLVTAVVLGIATFAYLHDKKQVDLYHSLPVERKLLFAVHVGVGIAIPAVLYLLFILLSLAVAGANGVSPFLVLSAAMRGYCLHMLYYLLVYGTTVLAMMMTGTRIAAILGTVVFFFFLPLSSSLILSFYDTFFATYYYAAPNLWTGIVSKLSPVFAVFQAMTEGVTIGRTIWALLAALLLLLASLLLYEKRPLETAGKTMAFWWSKGPIKMLLTVAFGMAGALFFYSIQEDLGWMVFGLFVGTVVSHCVIEIVYHSDFKKLFRHKWTMAICMAIGLIISIAFYFDLFQYDAYVPEEGQVAYASVDFGEDSWLDGGYAMADEEEILERARITDVGPILGLAREGIRQLELSKEEERQRTIGSLDDGLAVEEPFWYSQYDTHTWMTVCYTLKSGRKVYRTYSIWLDPVMEQADQVYTDPVYKTALFPSLDLDVEEAAGNAVYREMGSSVQTLQGDPKKWQAVVEAYREESIRLTMTTRTGEGPVGELLLIADLEEAYILEMIDKNASDRYGYGWYDGFFYPVYPSFTKTIQALADCGITAGGSLAPERFDHIEVTAYIDEDMYMEGENESTISAVTLTYTDPEQIEAILAVYGSDACRRKNGMVLRDDQYYISLGLKERDLSSSGILSGRFIKGKVPDFVVRDAKEKWKEEKAAGEEPDADDNF